jgi:NAD(P)H dehydrogenase (quinone)
MPEPKILVAFYSTYGTNRKVAEIAAAAAEAAGAEVRLRRFAETAPAEVVEGQEAWKASLESMSHISEMAHEDMEWAQGYFFSVPTRYGLPPSQMTAFTDTLGGLWSQGRLANKTFTGATSAQNAHGGQEGTVQALSKLAVHWGCILVPPGYADPVKFEDGGNPYGYSQNAGEAPHEASIRYQAGRLVDVTGKLFA